MPLHSPRCPELPALRGVRPQRLWGTLWDADEDGRQHRPPDSRGPRWGIPARPLVAAEAGETL